jgi:hypothetical protein
LNNKIVSSTKRTTAIFLSLVLMAGTITAISPSFINKAAAQADISDFVMDIIESEFPSNNVNYNDYVNEYVPNEREYANSYEEKNNLQYEEPYSYDGYYGDSYRDDDMYSKYPSTKDNKFVCKTGQFAGFFVQSPNICNLEIPAGQAGPQGPAGITEINSTNFYSVNGNIAMWVLGNTFTISRASCNAGDTAISGGYRSNQVDHVLFEQEDIDTWVTGVTGTSNAVVQTIVYCFDNPPLRQP